MAKQRNCSWRREIKKTKTEDSVEDRKRREMIKKSRLADTWEKKAELLNKRKEMRAQIKERVAESERELAESRRARMALKKKNKHKN
ncbi:hypothetical protein NEHOM01_0183 [Nematocida homosporus]|uniref:uncharacterized protein n=1 Tax=Nematocida homosporus TaxID=1912981 RepID=UPI00222041B1|nr:uncharacterized protein NEHOM01_0183 [Nematocida homosporus]KAI5184508.1 hypothetical protein NEHOM01_0183 [Nematocida homosporus]